MPTNDLPTLQIEEKKKERKRKKKEKHATHAPA
jgi:hypothetical protein